jgi:hypothetical protein
MTVTPFSLLLLLEIAFVSISEIDPRRVEFTPPYSEPVSDLSFASDLRSCTDVSASSITPIMGSMMMMMMMMINDVHLT